MQYGRFLIDGASTPHTKKVAHHSRQAEIRQYPFAELIHNDIAALVYLLFVL
jgi:hypothetical protein